MLFWTSFRTVTWFTVFSTQTASTLNHRYMWCQGECRDGKKSRTYKYFKDLKIRGLSMCSGKSLLQILFGSFQLLESIIGRLSMIIGEVSLPYPSANTALLGNLDIVPVRPATRMCLYSSTSNYFIQFQKFLRFWSSI